uniref:Uncharacterized protein n=1 Tax=Chromera velia CCMP2878 TaxID=1169474 RepID=A0A0G4I5S5_9ALVE|eukprot:Cvel_59.t1-p1 / transcript=Cvel_59.t1 / gene=Cvel_59 / organism=Chromera_velia_CCMP2878 / gene_product=hypothetical protein / transcript_product=hypothetical protein / location=Cvel_scaffold6:52979-54115(+) / protein_length=379 / sequence_SO=supercontig / SO=protein_coding / is_pseudo=false
MPLEGPPELPRWDIFPKQTDAERQTRFLSKQETGNFSEASSDNHSAVLRLLVVLVSLWVGVGLLWLLLHFCRKRQRASAPPVLPSVPFQHCRQHPLHFHSSPLPLVVGDEGVESVPEQEQREEEEVRENTEEHQDIERGEMKENTREEEEEEEEEKSSSSLPPSPPLRCFLPAPPLEIFLPPPLPLTAQSEDATQTVRRQWSVAPEHKEEAPGGLYEECFVPTFSHSVQGDARPAACLISQTIEEEAAWEDWVSRGREWEEAQKEAKEALKKEKRAVEAGRDNAPDLRREVIHAVRRANSMKPWGLEPRPSSEVEPVVLTAERVGEAETEGREEETPESPDVFDWVARGVEETRQTVAGAVAIARSFLLWRWDREGVGW